jgi:hypothetical protein
MELANRIAGAAAIGAAMLIGSGLSAPSAQAGYVVELKQVGANVVATGSGAIDLTGLRFFVVTGTLPLMWPSRSVIHTGETVPTSDVDLYHGHFGPGPVFGSGGLTFTDSATGDFVGVEAAANSPDDVYVPRHYHSNRPLSGTTTWDNQTFSSLGVTPGRYEWRWGSGANQNFTLAAIPEPATCTMMLLGFAGLGFLGFRPRLNGWPPKVA